MQPRYTGCSDDQGSALDLDHLPERSPRRARRLLNGLYILLDEDQYRGLGEFALQRLLELDQQAYEAACKRVGNIMPDDFGRNEG